MHYYNIITIVTILKKHFHFLPHEGCNPNAVICSVQSKKFYIFIVPIQYTYLKKNNSTWLWLPSKFLVSDLIVKGSDAFFRSVRNISMTSTYKIPDVLPSPAIMKLMKHAANATLQASTPSGPDICLLKTITFFFHIQLTATSILILTCKKS